MLRAVARRLTVLFVLIAWPAFFAWLSEAEEALGLIWFMLHQVYYLPFSWLGPPLFTPDPEVGFWVQPTGRALAVFVYVLLFYVVVRIVDRRATRVVG
jgi:hypothetical protein